LQDKQQTTNKKYKTKEDIKMKKNKYITYYELSKKNIEYICSLNGEFEQDIYLDTDTQDVILEIEKNFFEIIENYRTNNKIEIINRLNVNFENVI
jgi:uncharacterized membrane-anchored protein